MKRGKAGEASKAALKSIARDAGTTRLRGKCDPDKLAKLLKELGLSSGKDDDEDDEDEE